MHQVGANLGPGVLLAVPGGMALKSATTNQLFVTRVMRPQRFDAADPVTADDSAEARAAG